ncbi:MAG: peptidoglycan DD-metalloendopeptidase family protein [Deltaproteobacteria bacterium]|nr:peptidoglycan DD-metalloendopeptidase family protein [Deltaproteobacteria bacterium]
MNRLALLIGLVLPASAAALPPVPLVTPRITTSDRPVSYVLVQLADAYGLPVVERELIEPVVRWQRGLRDLMHGAIDGLAGLVNDSGFRIPDLSVLTVEPIQNTESSGFGWRDDPFRHTRKFHSGTDFRGKHGTPVVAAGDGVVIFCGEKSGYGNVVFIDHGGGVVTRYAHLSRILTKRDAVITAGQQLGRVGSTGRSTGPHLHFEVRLDDRAVDPTTAMTVAELERESPVAGRLAAFALSPELQADPNQPAAARAKPDKKPQTRPERPGRGKRVRPVS